MKYFNDKNTCNEQIVCVDFMQCCYMGIKDFTDLIATYKPFSHMRLRKPTGSLVLDRSIRDGDLARGIHALLCESKQSDATLIVDIVPLRL